MCADQTMALLMDLCGICVVLNATAAVASSSKPHAVACVVLTLLGHAHQKRWVFSTNGGLLAMFSIGTWAAMTGPTPEGATMLGRAAVGASASWYAAALLSPSMRFIACHAAVAGAVAAAARSEEGIERLQTAKAMVLNHVPWVNMYMH